MITFSNVTSPEYASEDKQSIRLTVKFDHLETEVEFLARPDDVEKHGSELFKRAEAGEFGPVSDYVIPTLDEFQKRAMFKAHVEAALAKQVTDLGFINMADAMTYCDEPAVPLYQQQALAIRKWRSLVWAWYETLVAEDKDVDMVNFETMPTFTL